MRFNFKRKGPYWQGSPAIGAAFFGWAQDPGLARLGAVGSAIEARGAPHSRGARASIQPDARVFSWRYRRSRRPRRGARTPPAFGDARGGRWGLGDQTRGARAG